MTGGPREQLLARLGAALPGWAGQGLRIAIAESLTGGLVMAELVSVPGAATALSGGVVAYDTRLKTSLLGVDAELLEEAGAVDPRVAEQMAAGVRRHCAVGGRPADIGLATTGAAGPDPLDGQPPGTVFLGLSTGAGEQSRALRLEGDRQSIRLDAAHALLRWLLEAVPADGA